LSRQFSGSGLGASAAAHPPTRKPTAATPAPMQLRQRAPSRGGAAPIEKVWHRLRAAPEGDSCVCIGVGFRC
jgi:hypothetical protein